MKKKSILVTIIAHMILIISSSGVSQKTVSPPNPFPPTPNPAQMRWHKAEYRMFIHFGMKTFYPSDNHMGDGREDPVKFNPKRFDARQWVDAAKAGGFDGIVLTAKHHDGFCNWQTQTTDHSVKSSPWKNGNGDIVKALAQACKQGEITFGVYISILDKHYQHYGAPGYDSYVDYYYDQLEEISTNYGPIEEYWFDGMAADEMQVMYKRIAGMIRKKQPDAVVYDSGTLVQYLPDRCLRWPGTHGEVDQEQSYRRQVGDQLLWYANEPSLILQGNWFHNGKPMKELETIKTYYIRTVGHGVTPLMNVSPNQDGLIDPASVEKLKRFKAWVDRLHAHDLTRTKTVHVRADHYRGNSAQFAPNKVIDDDYDTYYATDDAVREANIEIDLGTEQEINGFILQEYIPLGQRIDGFSIDCWINKEWKPVFSGKTIGYKRILLEGYAVEDNINIPPTDRIRLRIENALACPLVNTIQVIGEME